eukprot:7156757-Pyramimonas_sp.AAC.1
MSQTGTHSLWGLRFLLLIGLLGPEPALPPPPYWDPSGVIQILGASRNPTSPSRNDSQRNCLDQGSGQHTEEGSPSGGLLERLGGRLAVPGAS